MIKSIKLRCPLCEEESELYLSINPAVIVLKCPECWTPLMYTKTEIRILSEQELKAIAAPRTQSVFNSIFDKAFKKKRIIDQSASFERDMLPLLKKPKCNLVAKKPELVLRAGISPDDIIDLHNILAMSNDVQQFLKEV